ncbi:predicted protein [Naegleria gruberi]|uniref:Adenylosuccinate lyase n=1 Tax=Naegleria gruberi TaxID=5762 RepID=D2VSJ4_NAEGR|nr:uncharacterized protein NAEGRDRAFT_51920 [Naegleria gruberi]EFC40131.1 predicted protein [Naegleria gruberi]|eukprot:XP_002672875.1 predicted protein [Naegleria gruberi strain NEG-M]
MSQDELTTISSYTPSPNSEMDVCDNPLSTRYASKEMTFNFSPKKKFSTWRELWYALAIEEQTLGLEQITQEQLKEMREHLVIQDEEITLAANYEKKFRHDVMSHVHAFGDVCPSARPIIHLGATSCYVGDNTDLIQMRDGMKIIQSKLLRVMQLMKSFCLKYKDLPCLGFTHFQPAQLTTVGKRATLWLQDFLLDHEQLIHQLENLPFRGVKGTTGTQGSFLHLFNGDHEKVKELDRKVTKRMGFSKSIPVSGQTYTRKIDFQVLSVLSQISQSAHKFATDIRLLMSMKEIDEPFEKNQIGSSAMAYKRNPMRCERICSLSRFVMSLLSNTAHTHANQWFERTLDDSANRRLSIAQAFLGVDGILNIVANVCDGLVVWPLVIEKHTMAELPFMATENILMAAVKAGGDRQVLHEVIRVHSLEAARRVKEEGAENDLFTRLVNDEAFKSVISVDKIKEMMDAKLYIGRSNVQTEEFIGNEIDPVLNEYKDLIPTQDYQLKV